jgi:hypothetical protein
MDHPTGPPRTSPQMRLQGSPYGFSDRLHAWINMVSPQGLPERLYTTLSRTSRILSTHVTHVHRPQRFLNPQQRYICMDLHRPSLTVFTHVFYVGPTCSRLDQCSAAFFHPRNILICQRHMTAHHISSKLCMAINMYLHIRMQAYENQTLHMLIKTIDDEPVCVYQIQTPLYGTSIGPIAAPPNISLLCTVCMESHTLAIQYMCLCAPSAVSPTFSKRLNTEPLYLLPRNLSTQVSIWYVWRGSGRPN